VKLTQQKDQSEVYLKTTTMNFKDELDTKAPSDDETI